MSQIRRTHLAPDGMRLSLLGIDARNPPTNTPEHLVMDSSWPKVERLHTVAVIPSANLIDRITINFTLLDAPPFVELIRKKIGELILYDIKTHTSNTTTEENSTHPSFLSQTHRVDHATVTTVELAQRVQENWQPAVPSAGIPKGYMYKTPDKSLWTFIVLVFKP